MVRVVVVALLVTGAAVGCHSASGPGAGQSTGSAGTSGSAADAAAPLMCSDAGATGNVGSVGGDGLPFCQVTSRPSDPLNADAAVDANASSVPGTSNDDDNCNRLQTVANDAEVIDCLTGPLVKPEKFVVVEQDAGSQDAGVGDGSVNDNGTACGRAVIEEDGGTIPCPTGGILVDGDYQLVRYRSLLSGVPTTRRTIALYDGATYVEWAADEKPAATTAGHEEVLRLNTSMNASGFTWTVANVNCGSLTTTAYAYTADGTTLELFDYDATGALESIYTYQRTCSR